MRLERLRDLPDLLHAELPDLRLVAAQAEPVERDAGEMALRSLGEDGDLRDEVGAGLEVRQLLSLAAASLVAGADADDAAVVDEELLRRGLGEDHRPALLRLLREVAAELREGEDPVAVVPHRRRRRDAERIALREDVDRLAVRPRRSSGGPASGSPRRRGGAGRAGSRPRRRGDASRAACPSRAARREPRPAARPSPGRSSSSWPRRIAHASPAGPAPTMRTPTSIRSSAGSVGGATKSAALNGGGKLDGAAHPRGRGAAP